jgi:hypothetical protein
MVLFNYSTRELTAKIVYYGPGLCGKTTNLQYIFENLPGSVKGKMLSLATKTDRTLFFDFLPLDLGEIRGMKTRIQLYTVPGQVFYNETRRLVLKGADGVVFVADSQKAMLEANVDSYKNLEENLRVHSMKLSEMPLSCSTTSAISRTSPRRRSQRREPVQLALLRIGGDDRDRRQDTLKAITKLVLLHLTRRYDTKKPIADGRGSSAPVASFPARRLRRGAPRARHRVHGRREPGAASTRRKRCAPAPPLTAYDEGVDVVAEERRDIIELTDDTMSRQSPPPPRRWSGRSRSSSRTRSRRTRRRSACRVLDAALRPQPRTRPAPPAAPPRPPAAPPAPASRGVTRGGASRTASRPGAGRPSRTSSSPCPIRRRDARRARRSGNSTCRSRRDGSGRAGAPIHFVDPPRPSGVEARFMKAPGPLPSGRGPARV